MGSPRKDDDANVWKRCSTCRGPINFGAMFHTCSVSTCNRKRTTFRFCKVACWEEHLPLMRHREAWAVEETAPTRAQWQAQERPKEKPAQRPTREVSRPVDEPPPGAVPRRRIRVGSAPKPAATRPSAKGSDDVLVVVSRFKAYVRERFGMNTSDAVMEVLSDHLRGICHRAVDNARNDGRKTVMDRDFEFLRRR